MSWIKTISYGEAEKKLRNIYDRIAGPKGNIDNVLTVHSLRPHTLVGHMTLYKSVLHNRHNTLDYWYLESLGVYVSKLNHCTYCIDHHMAGLIKIIGQHKAMSLWNALENENFTSYFSRKEAAGLIYAKKLTEKLDSANYSWVQSLKDTGLKDGEILEINQVVCYFNYVNRVVVGLGVTTQGDTLGLSPKSTEDPDNWLHK